MPSSAVQSRPDPSGAGRTHQRTWTAAGRTIICYPSGVRPGYLVSPSGAGRHVTPPAKTHCMCRVITQV